MALFVKLWTDILADPKLMRAARKGAKSLVLLPWLIVFAKQADDDGRLTVNGQSIEPDDIVNVVPGVNAKQVVDCLASLVGIGVLVPDDDRALRFANWEERSGKPSDGAEAVNERVKKHRAKKRAERADGNAHETPLKRAVTEIGNATEKELEQEKEPEKEKEEEEEPERVTAAPSSSPLEDLEAFLAEHDFGVFAPSVDGIIRSARAPFAVTATLRMHLSGDMSHELATIEQLGLSCQQYLANGAEFNARFFAAFVRDVKRGKIVAQRREANNAEDRLRASDLQDREHAQRQQAATDRVVTDYEQAHPAEYAALLARAEKAVPENLTMGRELIVRAQLATLIRREAA